MYRTIQWTIQKNKGRLKDPREEYFEHPIPHLSTASKTQIIRSEKHWQTRHMCFALWTMEQFWSTISWTPALPWYYAEGQKGRVAGYRPTRHKPCRPGNLCRWILEQPGCLQTLWHIKKLRKILRNKRSRTGKIQTFSRQPPLCLVNKNGLMLFKYQGQTK